MRHIGAIAGRELRSYFVSPVAYAVLTMWAVVVGFFFVALVGFFLEAQRSGDPRALTELNFHVYVVEPMVQTLWIILMMLVPGLTMGLFTSEKANGTHELLLTSPISISDYVIGKFLAAAAMVTLLMALLAAYIGFLFAFGAPPPEGPQTAAALGALWLVALSNAAIGCLTSALTRSPLIAYLSAVVVVFLLFLLSVVAPAASLGGSVALAWAGDFVRWLSSNPHFMDLSSGLVETKALAYFAFMIVVPLVIAKTAVESVRWR